MKTHTCMCLGENVVESLCGGRVHVGAKFVLCLRWCLKSLTFTTSLHPCAISLSFKGRQRTATRTLSVSFILLFSWNKNIILLPRPCCYRNEYVDIIAEITVEYINVFSIKTKKYQKQYQSLTNTSQNKLCLPAWCIFLFGSTGERVTEKKNSKVHLLFCPHKQLESMST